MISEKDMEALIIADPEKYLGEAGLRLLSQQYHIRSYVFDLLFEDRHGAKLIVEIQKGQLDRNHTYKILDYYHEYKKNNPLDFIELLVIANKISDERKERLRDWGVSFREIPERVFVSDSNAMKIIGRERMPDVEQHSTKSKKAKAGKSTTDTRQRRVNFARREGIIVQSAYLMRSGYEAAQIAAKLNIPLDKAKRYVAFLKNNRHPSVVEFFRGDAGSGR